MRVVHFVSSYVPALGGIERHVAELATGMARRGHLVSVVTQRQIRSWPSREQLDGVDVLRFESRIRLSGPGVSARAWRSLRGLGAAADVVHLHNIHDTSTLAAASLLPGPFVLTPHYQGMGEARFGHSMQVAHYRAVERVIHQASLVICVSRAEQAQLQHDFQLPEGRLVVVPNGVRRVAPESTGGEHRSGRVIFSAGRLEPYKQHDLAVRALASLPEDYRLVIAGAGPDAGRLRELARSVGVGGRVELPGELNPGQLASWYWRSDLVVSLSRRECFGMSLAEALSVGVRVVGSDIPAHAEVVEATPSKWYELVAVDAEPERLAEVIIRMVAQPAPEGLPRLASWDEVVTRTLAAYEGVRAHVSA